MSCPDGVGGRGGIKHEASQRRERLWRQSSPSGINARKSVATVTKNSRVQLIVTRQSHRRPSLPHLTVRIAPAMITAAKSTHVTKNVRLEGVGDGQPERRERCDYCPDQHVEHQGAQDAEHSEHDGDGHRPRVSTQAAAPREATHTSTLGGLPLFGSRTSLPRNPDHRAAQTRRSVIPAFPPV